MRAVLGSLSGAMTVTEAALLAELEALGREVKRAKSEIAALRVDDINHSHIPAATDELDAVVEHTAEATNEILDSCEKLEALQATLSGEAAETARRRRHPDLRGLQLPGHHRPAHRQGRLGAEGDRARRRGRYRLLRPAGRQRRWPSRRRMAGPRVSGWPMGRSCRPRRASQAEVDRLLASFD